MKGFSCLYFLAYKAAGGEEGKARMEGGGHDKEVASSKKVHSRLQCKNRYPIYDQNGGKIAKIDTQFMTKTAEKSYPLGQHIPIQPILGSTPPPGAWRFCEQKHSRARKKRLYCRLRGTSQLY